MKYETFEKAIEIHEESMYLRSLACQFKNDEYHPTKFITFKRDNSEFRIRADIAQEISKMLWEKSYAKDKEFEEL